MAFAPHRTSNFNSLAYRSSGLRPEGQETSYLFQAKKRYDQQPTQEYTLQMQGKQRVQGPQDNQELAYRSEKRCFEQVGCQSERNLLQTKKAVPQQQTKEKPLFDNKKKVDVVHVSSKQYPLHKKQVDVGQSKEFFYKKQHAQAHFSDKMSLNNMNQTMQGTNQVPNSVNRSCLQPTGSMKQILQQIPEQKAYRPAQSRPSTGMFAVMSHTHTNTRKEHTVTSKIL